MLHLTTRRTGLYLEGAISDGSVFHLKSQWTLLWNLYSSKDWVIEFFTFLRLFDICGSPSVWRLAVEIVLSWLSRWTGSQKFSKLDIWIEYIYLFLWSRLEYVLSYVDPLGIMPAACGMLMWDVVLVRMEIGYECGFDIWDLWLVSSYIYYEVSRAWWWLCFIPDGFWTFYFFLLLFQRTVKSCYGNRTRSCWADEKDKFR